MNSFGRNCLIGVVHRERLLMTPTGSDEVTTTSRNLTIYGEPKVERKQNAFYCKWTDIEESVLILGEKQYISSLLKAQLFSSMMLHSSIDTWL